LIWSKSDKRGARLSKTGFEARKRYNLENPIILKILVQTIKAPL
jgi:hypothetical protein